jgi:TRAP-type C4-dicarboxylate transport system permease small subunit
MKSKWGIRFISRSIDHMIRILAFIGCVVFGMMVLVVVINVIGRLFLQHPLKGTVELVEGMMLLIAFFAIPYTTNKRGHVAVDLVVGHFPKHIKSIVYRVGFFVSAGILAVITYQAIVNTIYSLRNLHETTSVLFIPLAPFKFVMALGCLMICLQLLLDVLNPKPTDKV